MAKLGLIQSLLLALLTFQFVHGKHVVHSSASAVKTSLLDSTERADAKADTLFEEYWQYILQSDPEYATSVGHHLHDDKLTICGVKCYEDQKVKLQEFSKRAKDLLPSSTGKSRDNLQVLILQLAFQVDLIEIGNQFLAVSYLSGPQTDFMFLIDEVPMKTEKDWQNLISRYNAFPQKVDSIIELMNEGIKKGITQHERSLRNLEQTFLSFDKPAETSPFFEPFKKMENFATPDEIQKFQELAKQAITNKIIPAFKKLADYIKDDYRKHTRSGEGASSMVNGNEFYRKILNFHVTSDVTSETIHNMGLREVARIKGEMQAVISSQGLTLTPLEFNKRLRNNQSLTFKSGEEALSTYRDVMHNKIEPKLPQIFKNIPKEKLRIKAAPDFMAGGPKAFYVPGASASSTGTFYLDVSNIKDQKTYDVVTLSLHEGIPGHHMQIAYAKEQTDLPQFRRNLLANANNAFVEGWALYAEFLGNELGLFDDSYMLYGHLSEEIFRACRLVVDTGIHAFGWSRQQAIDYMAKNSASTVGNIEKEVDRYITWPGQACSYKFGEVKIKQLRQKAQNDLSTKFDIREFHDVILRSNGPMSFVEQKVTEYIKTAGTV